MKYKIKFTDNAKYDLNHLMFGILDLTKSKDIAINYIKGIQDLINILDTYPETGSYIDDRVLRSKGYRYLVYKKFVILYYFSKDENTVYILSVMNSKREYMKILRRII